MADRLRLEDEMGDLAGPLRELCRLFGIRPHLWDRSPALAILFETAAVARLAERIAEERGCGWTTAVDAAAWQLGIPADTMHSRLKRWKAATYIRVA